jgi:hypothetical protein
MANSTEAEKIAGEIFLNPNESLKCVAGSRQLRAFLYKGKLKRGFVVLSNRAIYCKGKYSVSRDRRHYQTKLTDFRIDLEEFQGMKYLQQKNPILLTLCFFFLLLGPALLLLDKLIDFSAFTVLNPVLDAVVCLLLSGVFFLLYYIHKRTLLEFVHTNGSLGVDIHYIPVSEERLLIRYLRALLNYTGGMPNE